MQKTKRTRDPLESLLRQSAPRLGTPDQARVERVCASLKARQPRPVAFARPMLLVKPLLRVAAVFALFAGAALVLKFSNRPAPVAAPETRHAVSVPDVAGFNTLVDHGRVLTDTLANESDNLMSDLDALTHVLNERTLAILF